MKHIYTLLSITLCYILTSCANIDEGEVDYARTISNQSEQQLNDIFCNPEEYKNSQTVKQANTRNCYETLYRKYTKTPAIQQGESISVHLMQGFIQDATETQTFSEFIRGRASNAEIVVIANVCEQGVEGCGLAFGPSSDKNGRVVYFSNGVKAKQYLNFSYLPVYGPIQYQGGSLIVQLAILELDELSSKQKALISTLADAGKKAYPPASEVLTLLDKLGSSFLGGSSNDTIFRYTFTLTPSNGIDGYQHPKISAGNFAFVKKKTFKYIQETEIWDELRFDNLTGRLVKRCTDDDKKLAKHIVVDGESSSTEDHNPCTINHSDGNGYKDYRDNTYLTFQIQSGFPARTLDNMQTLTLLMQDINAEKDKSATAIQQSAKELGEFYSRSLTQNKIRTSLSKLKTIIADDSLYHLDRFSLAASDYADSLISAQKNHVKYCTLADKSKCENYLQSEDIKSEIISGRRLLTVMDSLAETQSVLPLEIPYTNINASQIQQTFSYYYQHYYQESRFKNLWGYLIKLSNQYQQIENIQLNIKSAKDEKVIEKLTTRLNNAKQRFKSDIHKYLWLLKNETTLFTANQCINFTIPDNKKHKQNSSPCIKIIAKQKLIELTNLTTALINDSTDEKLINSCAISAIDDQGNACSYIDTTIINNIMKKL